MMFVPNVLRYRNIVDFFRDFFEENKKRDPKFSYGFVAKQLHWPRSYLSDVIHRRLSVTVNRCLEFAKHTQMETLETERLIFLALHGTAPEELKRLLNPWTDNHYDRQSKTPSGRQRPDVSSAAAIAVLEILRWVDGRFAISVDDLVRLLPTFKLSGIAVRALLIELEEREHIVRDSTGGTYKVLGTDLFGEEWYFLTPEDKEEVNTHRKELHQNFLESTQRFVDDFRGYSTINPGFVIVDDEQFTDVQARFIEFENYLKKMTEVSLKRGDYRPQTHRVCQYDLNLFSLFRSGHRQHVVDRDSGDRK